VDSEQLAMMAVMTADLRDEFGGAVRVADGDGLVVSAAVLAHGNS